jgi:hypothetical protein
MGRTNDNFRSPKGGLARGVERRGTEGDLRVVNSVGRYERDCVRRCGQPARAATLHAGWASLALRIRYRLQYRSLFRLP